MKNSASLVIGAMILLTVGLVGYWFWVPDVGALRSWHEFTTLPPLYCEIGDASVKGLTGTMYVGGGQLRADFKVVGQGVSSTFHTIVFDDGTAYTWADGIDFAERSVMNLGGNSTEAGLFAISRCKRVWNLDPSLFILPMGKVFKERIATLPPSNQ